MIRAGRAKAFESSRGFYTWFIMGGAALVCLLAVVGVCVAQIQIGDYTTVTDVSEHQKIDKDMQEISALTDEKTSSGFEQAKQIYENGKNSEGSSAKRTIQGFSTRLDTDGLMNGVEIFELYKAYYGQADYGNRFVLAAFDGRDEFSGKDFTFRAECAQKGAQWQNIWMYVLRELYDAVDDCEANLRNDNEFSDGSVKAWDEGWAFYYGVDGTDGVLGYSLAEDRSKEFKTFTEGKATVNFKLLALFTNGKNALEAAQASDCAAVRQQIAEMIPYFNIPIIQGAIKYAYLADPTLNGDVTKAWSEGYAFSRAILPQINKYSRDAADLITANFDPQAASPVKDGYLRVVEAFESVYPQLGVTCEDIGAFHEDDVDLRVRQCISSGSAPGAPAEPVDKGSSSLSGGAIAGIVIGVLAVVAIVVIGGIIIVKRRASHEVARKAEYIAE